VCEALDKKADIFDIYYVSEGSNMEKEIYETGVNIYGKNQKLRKRGRIIKLEQEKEIAKKNIRVIEKMMDYIDKIKKYAEGKSCIDFVTDDMLHEVCAFNLLQLGEQSNKLRSKFRDLHGHIPWDDMRGIRNRIAHEYEAVDLEIVWNIIENELDGLRKSLSEILNNER
jgi:uncharacterized protein with HEPN domain